MYVKRLTMHGFKSFPQETAFEFGPGVTAIVGPNGSGKSNVADAVRWVLGEQGLRLLRARKQEDVIFSGGGERAPLGMAEVTLTLDNSDHWLPLDFAEVEIGRRAYRDGDSEYLVKRLARAPARSRRAPAEGERRPEQLRDHGSGHGRRGPQPLAPGSPLAH